MRRFIKCGLCLITAAGLAYAGFQCRNQATEALVCSFGGAELMYPEKYARRDAQGRYLEPDDIPIPSVYVHTPEGRRHAERAETFRLATYACFVAAGLAALLGAALLIPRRGAETKPEAPGGEAEALERIYQLLAAAEKGEVKP